MMNKELTLRGLTHGFKTDLARRVVNNADAALIVLWEHGGLADLNELRSELQAWRPGRQFTYLFNKYDGGGYGFVGQNFETASNAIWHAAYVVWGPRGIERQVDGHHSVRRTYWYRRARGVYAITAEGLKRLGELGLLGKPS